MLFFFLFFFFPRGGVLKKVIPFGPAVIEGRFTNGEVFESAILQGNWILDPWELDYIWIRRKL